MVEDFYRPGAVMDFPKGGSGELAGALARGVTKHSGCSVRRSSPVAEVVVEDGRAAGVRMQRTQRTKDGKQQVIRARKAVVSNADLHGTFGLVARGKHQGLDDERDRLLSPSLSPSLLDDDGDGSSSGSSDGTGVPLCKSFMHLHLGVDASLLPPDLPPQWTVVTTWDGPIDAPGKVVVVSVPSLLDPSLAPEGHHVIHAYAAGNEPFSVWEPFLEDGDGITDSEAPEAADAAAADSSSPSPSSAAAGGSDAASSSSYRRNEAYQALKEERSRPLWDAIKRRVPNIEEEGVCKVVQVGTPLTHKRFLRRHRGNYGPAIAAGNPAKLEFPPVTTPLEGYYRCGDSTTAGIGVPAVASSGAQCANAILSVWEQLEMNKKIKM